MKEILLTQGKITTVDEEDYKQLSQWKWFYHSCGYAGRWDSSSGKRKLIFMHRFIMQTPEGMETDHIDCNKLNNRRNNLRICTSSQNRWNRTAISTNTSGVKGVSWEKARNKWRVGITYRYKHHNLGRFDSIEDAAEAYKSKAIELFENFYRE